MKLNELIIFTDLDGCLLNKHDYEWRAAESCLTRLRDLRVPVVMASSKTVSEMERIAEEIPCVPAPFIAENGGAIRWGPLRQEGDDEMECTGISRTDILNLLTQLKSRFRFRSFRDLGLYGVMKCTDLEEDRARPAMDRHSTEPLLWDDSDANREQFARILRENDLTLTKGGRFWHVAGKTSKGEALQRVMQRFRTENSTVVAIGDSPIDQSMLDVVNIPVGMRVGGVLNVQLRCPPGIVPNSEGALGWAEAVSEILERFV